MNLGIEAMAGYGVRAIDLSEHQERFDVFRIKDNNNYNLEKTIAFLVQNLNRKYDYFGVLYLGLLKLLSKLKIPTKNRANKLQKSKDYFCSELCYEAFHKGGGLDIVPQISEADITSPGDITKSPLISKVSPLTSTAAVA